MSDKPATGAPRKAQGGKNNKATAVPGTGPGQAGKPDGSDRGPPDGVKALALDYPFALIAGGVAVGVLIGALLPRRQASRLSRPLLAAVGAASEFGLAYAQKALSQANAVAGEASAAGSKVIEAAGEGAEALADDAAGYVGRIAAAVETAPVAIRDSGRRLAESMVRLTSQLRH